MKINLGAGQFAEIESVEDIDLDQEPVYIGGKRFTEADVERLSQEILSRRGALGGRPPISDEGVSRIGARVPTPLRNALRDYAKNHNVKESAVVRDALAAYLYAA
jgi:hypothetical protein